MYIPFGGNLLQSSRLGGSALAQCLGQIGSLESDLPDLKDPKLFSSAFNCIQQLIKRKFGQLNLFELFCIRLVSSRRR